MPLNITRWLMDHEATLQGAALWSYQECFENLVTLRDGLIDYLPAEPVLEIDGILWRPGDLLRRTSSAFWGGAAWLVVVSCRPAPYASLQLCGFVVAKQQIRLLSNWRISAHSVATFSKPFGRDVNGRTFPPILRRL